MLTCSFIHTYYAINYSRIVLSSRVSWSTVTVGGIGLKCVPLQACLSCSGSSECRFSSQWLHSSADGAHWKHRMNALCPQNTQSYEITFANNLYNIQYNIYCSINIFCIETTPVYFSHSTFASALNNFQVHAGVSISQKTCKLFNCEYYKLTNYY